MDFIEEETPSGLLLKIFFKKWQFLAFDRKKKSIYADNEGKSLLHHVPIFVLMGNSFHIRRDYDREYFLLKVRNGSIIVPYQDIRDNKNKYVFIKTDENLDVIPVRIILVKSITKMIRDIDINLKPDCIIIDDGITSNDIIIINSRYKTDNIVHAEMADQLKLKREMSNMKNTGTMNLNMMSSNPVFLAKIHLRKMDLSMVNQLLLDFELTSLDTEYILNYIQKVLSGKNDKSIGQKKFILEDLKDSFQFYLYLLQRNDKEITEMIDSRKSLKNLAPFITLLAKAKSLYPGSEEQNSYAEYKKIIMEKRAKLKKE